MTPTIQLRTPQSDEKAKWLPLWHSYLSFYETTLPTEITDMTWARFHDPAEPLTLIGAYDADEMIGFTVHVLHRSSWARNCYCYLEDLYVSEAVRGRGIGRSLMEEVKKQAILAGAARLYLNTKQDNQTARVLYDKIGTLSEFVQYRVALDV